MAITFLAVSRRERGAVSIVTDQTTSRLAADAGLERARAELLVPMLVNTNAQLFDLLVSTNYFNAAGFDPTPPPNSDHRLNVNYDYTVGGGSPPPRLTDPQLRQNIGNLYYNPRPPVFVRTNAEASPLDFRFYLDLNRNGRFDPTGFQRETNRLGQAMNVTNRFVGDPEWNGILENPNLPHSASNRFVSRYAFIAIPAGKTLDVNCLHNQTVSRSLNSANDGFFRNQGVGTWEINLAAFLHDLNTNYWGASAAFYNYLAPSSPNRGIAFQDALGLLSYRYNDDYNTLLSANDLFGGNPFARDGVDGYSDGPIVAGMLGMDETTPGNQDLPARPWAGADNTNHFFTTQDFFDKTKTQKAIPPNGIGFTDRLLRAAGGVSTYDRMTFYRLLSQLGTDSSPEKDKINVNYQNGLIDRDVNGAITAMRIVPDLVTNFYQWSPTQFFMLAADKLVRTYTTNWFLREPANYMATFFNANTNGMSSLDVFSVANRFGLTNARGDIVAPGFGVTDIPVWVSNKFVYTPSVHRLLQLAANIYDATTNYVPNGYDPNTAYPPVPHVFRPLFRKGTNQDLYIAGYEEVPDFGNLPVPLPPILDLPVEAKDVAEKLVPIPSDGIIRSNIFNVPWVVGAKEGLPTFNEFSMQSIISVTRRLEFRRRNWVTGNAYDPNNRVAYTNQLYSIGISNVFGMEAWNSYQTNYPRRLQMLPHHQIEIVLWGVNSLNQSVMLSSNFFTTNYPMDIDPNTWAAGVRNLDGVLSYPAASFVVPRQDTVALFGTNSTNFGFLHATVGFDSVPQNLGVNFHRVPGPQYQGVFPVPRWWVQVRSRLRYLLFDNVGSGTIRLVDYVALSRDEDPVDVTFKLAGERREGDYGDSSQHGGWYTNRVTDPSSESTQTIGIQNQIGVGLGLIARGSQWRENDAAVRAAGSIGNARAFFDYNLNDRSGEPTGQLYKTNIFFAPFDPFLDIYQHSTLQANDPLVHYTVSDLFDVTKNTVDYSPGNPPLENLGRINVRYQPWSARTSGARSGNEADYNPANKDPRVYQSDNWEFPTNKLPNVGWLGRVHRGTPWQTIYMKSTDFALNDWSAWTGNTNLFDAYRTRPAEDRLLFDLFTTAVNDNATRGQLSVNQSGLAAWSAVLSGVVTLTNTAKNRPGARPLALQAAVIEPAGIQGENSQVGRIVHAINAVRATNTLLFPDGAFHSVGDVLAVPELTYGPELTNSSPFLNLSDRDVRMHSIDENMYERIPQQIMSLLRLDEGPRFVIYSFGQTLKPAPRSIITSGSFFGMCTNYQITAETATRAVVRIEGAPVPGRVNLATPRLVMESFNVIGPDR
jgi:hypothetical protein